MCNIYKARKQLAGMASSQVMKDITGYMTFDQAERFVKETPNLRDKIIILLMWRCGLRVSEVVTLKKKWIYFDEGIIAVYGKGKKFRRVPVEKKTLELLKKYTEEIRGDDRIFHITRFGVFKMVRKLGKRVGIERVGEKGVHPHHFRHSFAIVMVKNGMPLPKLQTILGHSSLAATTFYLQFRMSEIAKDYNRIWSKMLEYD